MQRLVASAHVRKTNGTYISVFKINNTVTEINGQNLEEFAFQLTLMPIPSITQLHEIYRLQQWIREASVTLNDGESKGQDFEQRIWRERS